MIKLLKRYWNFSLLGIPKAFVIILKVFITSLHEKISSFFWKKNLNKCGENVTLQIGSVLRYPGNITIGKNVNIGRKVRIESENMQSKIIIGDCVNIDKNVYIDYTGNLRIEDNVMISENAIIYSHSHKYDPKSHPVKISKLIKEKAWIGANSIIMPNVKVIGSNSIIAAGAIVTKNVDDNSIVAGNPAKEINKNSSSFK